MPIPSRLLAASALALTLGACAGPPSIPVAENSPPITLEGFFAGRTVGKGSFVSPIAGVDRKLTVVTNGRWNGKTLTLQENFFYADGERDRKTWHITKVGPGVYTGTREDVIGPADIRQEGDRITFRYTADVVSKKDGSRTRLDFADAIVPDGPGKVINRANVSKFGVPVASVDLTFVKSGKRR